MKTETELRQEYTALKGELKNAFAEFVATPSATNWVRLERAMQARQEAYQAILDARERPIKYVVTIGNAVAADFEVCSFGTLEEANEYMWLLKQYLREEAYRGVRVDAREG